jgi:putative redox protein
VANAAHLVALSIESGLRFAVSYPKGARAILESPSADAPNPVESVLGALGGCSAMDVLSLLRKKRQPIRRYEVRVSGERRAEHPRIFTRIEVVHHLWGDVSPAAVAEAIELSDTKYCSVHGMLGATAELVSRFVIHDAAGAGVEPERGLE